MISRRFLLIGTAFAAAGAAAAQPPHPAPPAAAPQPSAADTDADRAAAVDRLAAMLEESYVFPDIGRRYAEALRRKAAAGGYANAGDPAAFARSVTADLQAVHPDLHLRVRPASAGPIPRLRPGPGPGAGPAGGPGHRLILGGPDAAAAIGRAGWIADGVAYIELTLFPGTDESIARVRRLMAEYRNARAIIFDIRGHHGGGPAEMDVIFSYLFGRETLLVGMDTRTAAERMGVGLRRDGPPGGVATLRTAAGPAGVERRFHYAIPGPDTPLRRAQVFLLTSHITGSAAEHFSLALQRTHRATLIGEATAGANHFGRMVDLGGYAAFLPVGRTFDPDTGRDWEGTGVSPDVAVPAGLALDEALRRLGVTPAQRRPLQPVGAAPAGA